MRGWVYFINKIPNKNPGIIRKIDTVDTVVPFDWVVLGGFEDVVIGFDVVVVVDDVDIAVVFVGSTVVDVIVSCVAPNF